MSRYLRVLLIPGIPLLAACFATSGLAQVKIPAGNAARGERVLFDRGCVICHGLNGDASDLSRTPRHAVTPESLSGEMWNHMPEMLGKANASPNARLTSADAADLFAYLYSVLYFAFPGSVTRGKDLFERKNCAGCHLDKAAPQGTSGRAVSSWEAVDDPIMWTERMWNHTDEMKAGATQKGFQWPTLSAQDIADLMIYLRSLPVLRTKSGTFRMGEPEQGKLVFERSCQSCHSFGANAGNVIDLLGRSAPLTVTGYIAAMWNHAPAMHANSGGDLPKLRAGEMSDLAAFLFSETYFFRRGDAAQGRRVFENKKCARCHEERKQETGAPDLTRAAASYSPVTLISAVWRHGPALTEMMRRNTIPWPRFHDSEMADLIAYLNSRVSVHQ